MLCSCGGPEEGGGLWKRGLSLGAGPRLCFEAVRQAEMWVRAGKAGLLLEESWVWSTAELLTGSRSRVCLWE